MLGDNIKNLRKAKGLSQDELAVKVNVVRQTVSKWEKGLSVPDSELLIRLAEALETSVTALLDETVPTDEASELQMLASKLEIINEQIAGYREARRKTWRSVFIIAAMLSLCALAVGVVRLYHAFSFASAVQASTAIIGGADGPTAIFVTGQVVKPLPLILTLAAAVVSVVGICKTRKK